MNPVETPHYSTVKKQKKRDAMLAQLEKHGGDAAAIAEELGVRKATVYQQCKRMSIPLQHRPYREGNHEEAVQPHSTSIVDVDLVAYVGAGLVDTVAGLSYTVLQLREELDAERALTEKIALAYASLQVQYAAAIAGKGDV